MMGTYMFMFIIYTLFLTCAMIFLMVTSMIPVVSPLLLGILNSLEAEYRVMMGICLLQPLIQLTLPILLSICYSYSQYLYYGNHYYDTMTDEFNSRSTKTYFRILQASVNEKLHTSLNFI